MVNKLTVKQERAATKIRCSKYVETAENLLKSSKPVIKDLEELTNQAIQTTDEFFELDLRICQTLEDEDLDADVAKSIVFKDDILDRIAAIRKFYETLTNTNVLSNYSESLFKSPLRCRHHLDLFRR